MRVIKVYQPPGKLSPFEAFLAQQDPKLRQKIRWTLFRMMRMELCDLKEPHFKHFALERYGPFYNGISENGVYRCLRHGTLRREHRNA